MAKECEVAVIGAGPYGLSAGAHLRARGVDIQVFGEPMSFWERSMPEGLLLRSPWEGSQLSDPAGSLTLERYEAAHGIRIAEPIAIEHFVAYGRWFQSLAVPHVDRRQVALVDKIDGAFRVLLEDGTEVRAARVVVAGGIAPFAVRPQQLVHLPAEVASHSSELRRPRQFSGRQVVVIGGGQSALESAALLHEAGADVEVLVRDPVIYWTWQRPWLHTFRPVGAVLYAWPDVGPAFISHFIARPAIYRRLSRSIQDGWAARADRPAGAGWLKGRAENVRISTCLNVTSASVNGNRVNLKLSDGTDRSVDHVVMATGYRVKLENYGFLSSSLLETVRRINDYPQLSGGFESSLRGLYFLGAPAAWSFGPLMHFVAGTDFAARTLSHCIIAARRPAPSRSSVPVPPSICEAGNVIRGSVR